MLSRLATLTLACVLAASQSTAAPPAFRGGGQAAAAVDAIHQLMATMPADSLQLLDGASLYADAISPLLANGIAGCFFSGNPGPGCVNGAGNPAGGDAYATDADAQTQSIGMNPLTSANVFSFTGATYIQTPGAEKVVALGGGGHDSTNISGVFTFDAQAAAACLVAAGGYGHTPCGHWVAPIKPARALLGSNARPSYSGQGEATCTASWAGGQASEATINVSNCFDNFGNGPLATILFARSTDNAQYIETTTGIAGARIDGVNSTMSGGVGTFKILGGTTTAGSGATVKFTYSGVLWMARNADGQDLPMAMHSYYSATWLGGGKVITSGGQGQGFNFSNATPGALFMYDDASKTTQNMTPGGVGCSVAKDCAGAENGWCFNIGETGAGGMQVVGSNLFCLNMFSQRLWKWSNYLTTPTKTVVAGNVVGNGINDVVAIPDPIVPGATALFTDEGLAQGSQSGTCHGAYSEISGRAFFHIWTDVANAGINPTSSCQIVSNWGNGYPFPLATSFGSAYAYNASLGKLLGWWGGATLYQVNMTANPSCATGSEVTCWTMTAFKTGLGGCANASGSGSCATFGPPDAATISTNPSRMMILNDGSGAIINVTNAGAGSNQNWLWKF